jgi:hypothetical protein
MKVYVVFKFEDNPFKNNKSYTLFKQKSSKFRLLAFKVNVIYEWKINLVWFSPKGCCGQFEDNTPRTSKVRIKVKICGQDDHSWKWPGNLQGQGHKWAKVNLCLIYMKVSSLRMLSLNMKSIHLLITQLYSQLKQKMKISKIWPLRSRSFISEGQGLFSEHEGLCCVQVWRQSIQK